MAKYRIEIKQSARKEMDALDETDARTFGPCDVFRNNLSAAAVRQTFKHPPHIGYGARNWANHLAVEHQLRKATAAAISWYSVCFRISAALFRR